MDIAVQRCSDEVKQRHNRANSSRNSALKTASNRQTNRRQNDVVFFAGLPSPRLRGLCDV